MILGQYSFGIGDRFGRQGVALLAAFLKAKEAGIDITPVWNKSHREHSIIGTEPGDVRLEADEAVKVCGWDESYFVDADHIGLGNVEHFMHSCDFFTLDVADYIGKLDRPAAGRDRDEVDTFVRRHGELIGSLEIDGIDKPLHITEEVIRAAAAKFLLAARQAGKIFRHIKANRGGDDFVTEVSMDETDRPQTPVELLIILAVLADEGVPVQTVAPKFSGRFNKGVDYVGDVVKFAAEFEADVAVVKFAVRQFGLPANLKLSVHSGSDKFSIYGSINKAMTKFDAGVHIKTAGTTWLEELTGLAMAGGSALEIAKEIYTQTYERIDELTRPYVTVVDIDRAQLPQPAQVQRWDRDKFVSVLRHDQSCPSYNPHVRQLLHVGYKVAAEIGGRFLDALDEQSDIVEPNVTANIWDRHIAPIFMNRS
jgi:hypothetical protein